MSERIVDGKGRGYEAEVSSNNKLEVFSVSENEMTFISQKDGDAFMFATANHIDIPIADTIYGVFYLKNTSETKNLYIESIRACSTAVNLWNLYKNPTTSTVIDDQTAGVKNTLNFTSASTADANVYQGTGTNFTGGSLLENWVNDVGHSTEEYGGAIILGKNDSIGVSAKLKASGDACIRVVGYYL